MILHFVITKAFQYDYAVLTDSTVEKTMKVSKENEERERERERERE